MSLVSLSVIRCASSFLGQAPWMNWPLALEFAREVRWLWPSSTSACGPGLAAVALLGLCCLGVGCCCGACITLALTSSTCQRLLHILLVSFVPVVAPASVTVDQQSLRRRLAGYREGRA